MYKTLIAGVTAIALTLTTAAPVQAQNNDQEAFAKFLFGVLAAAAIGSAIKNNDRDRAREQAHQRYVAPAPQIRDQHRGARSDRRVAPPLHAPSQGRNAQRLRDRRDVLPRNCLNAVETRYGTLRLFGRQCLERNYRHTASLPRACAVRIVGADLGVRRGWDPQCLRSNGYRARR